jgi:hypothetical protein
MQKQPIFRRKQLVIAVGMAMLGGAMTGCSSSSDSPAPGTFTYVANGGNGGSISNARGGEGGDISLYNDGGTGGVEIRKTGKANTNFSSPIKPAAANLGSNPLTISSSTTIRTVDYNNPIADGGGTTALQLYVGTDDVIRTAVGVTAVYASDPVMAAGTPYLRTNISPYRIYLSAGTVAASDTVVTGLSIAAGATLTLAPNNPCNTEIDLVNDIDNSGTITRALVDGCSLYIYANTYIASGSVVNTGDEDSENGGGVYIYTATGIANKGSITTSGFDENNDVNGDEQGGDGGEISLGAQGYVVNSGMLDSSGGDGKLGGGSGHIVRMRGAYVENNAEINAEGGNNIADPIVSGDGGDGGLVLMTSDYGTNNTASINNSGGTGYGGGDGAEIQMRTYSWGQVKNAAAITSNGGHALVDGQGGDAGYLRMQADGEDLLNSGDLSFVGGDNTGTNATGYAGDGGYVDLEGYGGEGDKPAGNIVISGNINLSGGNAVATGSGYGGEGGNLEADVYPTDAGTTQKVSMLGYVSITSNGGTGADGAEYPGDADGGHISLYADHRLNNTTLKYTAGSAFNEVPISAYGGNSTSTELVGSQDGGDGGEVAVQASTDEVVRNLGVTAKNTADVDVHGGNATGDETVSSYSGSGGQVFVRAYSSADNSGNVNADGGNGGEYGGNGGYLAVNAVSGAAKNSGDFSAMGGDGVMYGRQGGSASMYGTSASNSGDINVNGGNATAMETLDFTEGGDGGEISIMGLGLNGAASNSGSVTYTFGIGDTNGEEGCLQVGLTFTGNCN